MQRDCRTIFDLRISLHLNVMALSRRGVSTTFADMFVTFEQGGETLCVDIEVYTSSSI